MPSMKIGEARRDRQLIVRSISTLIGLCFSDPKRKRCDTDLCGFAAPQCGEARRHRYLVNRYEATPPPVEAQPRQIDSDETPAERQSLSALCGGKAAKPQQRNKLLLPEHCRKRATFAALCLLLAAFCGVLLLPPGILRRRLPHRRLHRLHHLRHP